MADLDETKSQNDATPAAPSPSSISETQSQVPAPGPGERYLTQSDLDTLRPQDLGIPSNETLSRYDAADVAVASRLGLPVRMVTPAPSVPRDERGRILPGHSLNPGGMPAGTRRLSQAYAEALAAADRMRGNPSPDKVLGVLRRSLRRRGLRPKMADRIAAALLSRAIDPASRDGVSAAKELADRTEGPVTQRVVTETLSYVVEVPAAPATVSAWLESVTGSRDSTDS